MTGSRRGFLAFVGSTAVAGAVTRAAAAVRPTLILPPALVLAPAERWPLLTREETQMGAFIHVGLGLDDDVFRDWLETGLQATRHTPGYPSALRAGS